MIPYGRQYIDDDDIAEVVKVLKSDFLTTGPKIQEFEEKFASRVGAKYAVVVSSGTAALHVACLAAGLTPGQELITSPMTFAASANCALYCGARPVFVDINDQGLLNADAIEAKITKKSKVILPVHYAGMPCDLTLIKEIATKYNLVVIEDACHALGSTYKGSKIGDCSFSDLSVFSFHPVKHITTGEGGMITTNNLELYYKLRSLRTHGIVYDTDKFQNKQSGSWYYEMQMLGFNYRMTDIQAALGISQLKKLDGFIQRRREIIKKYNEAFHQSEFFDMIYEKEGQFSAYHLFPILLKSPYIDRKRDIFQKIRKEELWVQVHYIPVYFHPYYRKLGYVQGLCPNSEMFYKRQISIPLYPAMTEENIEYVTKTIMKTFHEI